MDATKPCYYFTKRKENKDLPSLKSRNTVSKEEMYKKQARNIKNQLSGTYLQSLIYSFLLDYNSNIYFA